MNNGFDDAGRDERLSALVDGELDVPQVAAVCEQWRGNAALRECWHSYQLIGDVLRSDDLSTSAAHDADFLARLRKRLADEPVVLAPTPAASIAGSAGRAMPRGRRRAWAFGSIAAGFFAVLAGALTLGGSRLTSEPESRIASADVGASSRGVEAVLASDADLQPTVVSGQLIRDARLDGYLAAHQQWTGRVMLGGHASFLQAPGGATAPR